MEKWIDVPHRVRPQAGYTKLGAHNAFTWCRISGSCKISQFLTMGGISGVTFLSFERNPLNPLVLEVLLILDAEITYLQGFLCMNVSSFLAMCLLDTLSCCDQHGQLSHR